MGEEPVNNHGHWKAMDCVTMMKLSEPTIAARGRDHRTWKTAVAAPLWDFSIYSSTNLGEGAFLGVEIHPLLECSIDSNARMYSFPKSTKLLEIKVSNYLNLVNLEHWQLRHKVKISSSST